MNNKYINSKIYKLIDNTNGNIYIGSTIRTLKYRLKKHRCEYKRYVDGKRERNIKSFDIIKNRDYKMELIENYPCDNRKQLEEKEAFYIKNIECINKCVPCRTPKRKIY